METGAPARLSPAEGRKFGLLVGGAFAVLGLVLWRRGHPVAGALAAGTGAALILAGLIIPGHLGPVYRAWMGLALLLSKVTAPLFMGLLYFLLLTPAGLLARAVGHHALSPPKGAATYWRPRPAEGRRGAMDHQF